MFSSPFSIAIISLGEERANLSAICTFDLFALVWFCLVTLPLGVRKRLRLVIVALPGASLTINSRIYFRLFSVSFCLLSDTSNNNAEAYASTL